MISLPLDGLILDFGYLVLHKRQNLLQNLGLDGLIAQKAGWICLDLVHKIIQAHESAPIYNFSAPERVLTITRTENPDRPTASEVHNGSSIDR